MKNIEIIDTFVNQYNLNHLFPKETYHLFHLQNYKKGEIIVSAQEEVTQLYFVVSGGVDIHSFLQSGRSIFINKLAPSEIFGDVEYFGQIPMLFDVISNTDSTIMSIPFKALEKSVGTNFLLWKFLGITSTKKLLKTNKAILLKESFNLKNILASYIVKNNFEIYFNSLNELAEELNVSYRNLTRVIKFFCDKNIIIKKRKSIATLSKEEIIKYSKEI